MAFHKETAVNDEELNTSIRKFLKMVGVSSQREIEQFVTRALNEGAISGTETFPARMTLEIAGLRLRAEFDGEIRLEAPEGAP
jgi:predicted lactoylglutathione lyase